MKKNILLFLALLVAQSYAAPKSEGEDNDPLSTTQESDDYSELIIDLKNGIQHIKEATE